MGFTTAPTPPAQLALAYVASTFTFTCLYVCHMRLLHFVWPHLFELDLRLRMTNAERCNGVWHSTATVLLSGYGLWSSYAQHGWFQYDAPNSPTLELSLALTIGYFAADTAAMWLRYFTVPGETDEPVVFTVRALSRRGLGDAAVR